MAVQPAPRYPSLLPIQPGRRMQQANDPRSHVWQWGWVPHPYSQHGCLWSGHQVRGQGGQGLAAARPTRFDRVVLLVSSCCCGASPPSPSGRGRGRGRGRCRRGWRCRGGEDLDARAPLLSAGLPAPSPGGLVGLSSSHHPQCHCQLTVIVTGDGHASLLAYFSQPEKCPQQAVDIPRPNHPGQGGGVWNNVETLSKLQQ